MAVLFPVEGEPKNIIPANNKTFTLEELQELVGGYIEPVRLDNGKTLIVNEEGKIHGLPRNHRATEYAVQHGELLPLDYIVGPAVLCSKREFR